MAHTFTLEQMIECWMASQNNSEEEMRDWFMRTYGIDIDKEQEEEDE